LAASKHPPAPFNKGEFDPGDRQIAASDHQIDRLVYELYELTEEEIKIVEESTK